MTTTFFQTLALATTTTTLALAVISSPSVTAATITYDFELNSAFVPTSPFTLPLQPPITGSFTYDEESLVPLNEDIYYGDFFGPHRGPVTYPNDRAKSCQGSSSIPCITGGSSAPLTNFQINFSGNVFTKATAQTFDIRWNINPSLRLPYHFGTVLSTVLLDDKRVLLPGLKGTATWNNPYLNLSFPTFPLNPDTFLVFASSTLPNLCTNCTSSSDNGIYTYVFPISQLNYTKRTTTTTPIPEGPQELALLGLGLFGIATLLKKKLSSSQPN
jgi:hypothetical protein